MRYLSRGLYCICVVVWFFVLLCVIAQPAYAYVDPGSGLFVIQVIGSTFVGFAFLIRKRIRQMLNALGKRSRDAVEGVEQR